MGRKSNKDKLAETLALAAETEARTDRGMLEDLPTAQLEVEIDRRASVVERRVAQHLGEPMPAAELEAAYTRDESLARALEEMQSRTTTTTWTN